MRIILHPLVHSDILAVMEYYERVASRDLAEEYYAELRRAMEDPASRPEAFSIRTHDVRRVNLSRFPYHFLFRIVGDSVRILVVRHHRRHPLSGTARR